MVLAGKGFFITDLTACEQGNPVAIARPAVRAGLSHGVIQVAEEGAARNVGLLPAAVRVLRDQGVTVWGWQFVTGDQPLDEARQAVEQLRAAPLEGLVICAEDAYKLPGKDSAARLYLSELRAVFPDLPLAFSSYRFPSYHPQIPWETFLAFCDYNMPKVYWAGAHNPQTQLTRSYNEFAALRPVRPLIPVGPAYPLGSWRPTPQEVLAFLDTAQNLQLNAVNFWHWDVAGGDAFADVWRVIADYAWRASSAADDLMQRYFTALNRRDLSAIEVLYAGRGVHVTPRRTVAGRQAIAAWYADLLGSLPAEAQFELLNYRGASGVRYFAWDIVAPPVAMTPSPPVDESLVRQGYQRLFQGVYYKKAFVRAPREHIVHIVRVDLNAPGVQLVVTPREGLGTTTSAFLERYGLQLAVNGDEWMTPQQPKGLAASEGDIYAPASLEPTMYISQDNRVQIGGPPPARIWNAISGSHTLVRDGKVNGKLLTCRKPEYCNILAPHTAVGLTADGQLLLVVVEGLPLALRRALSLKELAYLMASLGARQAISLDGGGSSTLVTESAGRGRVRNMPTDGQERVVANHLGVRAQLIATPDRSVLMEGEDTIGVKGGKIVYHFSLMNPLPRPA